jgi:hypothetical protein
MSDVLEGLLKNRNAGSARSYFIGLERGRIWAEDCADYFELREWSEHDADDFDDLVLPHDENRHFRILHTETPIEWEQYLRGWLDGVREIRQKY